MARRPAKTFAPLPPKTVSLYVRLSREADERNLSKAGMLADLRALAGREGLKIIAEHIDDGITGARRDRPAFRAWLTDAIEGRTSALAAWAVDRMTREGLAAAGQILDVIEGRDPATGKVVRAPVRLLDTTGLDSEGDPDSFRWRFVVAAEVARSERSRMSARSKARAERARARGDYLGGSAPFGFRRVRRDGVNTLEIEPSEAAPLQEAGRRVIAGEPLARVARGMSKDAPPRQRASGKHATSWSRPTLRQSLLSDAAKHYLWTPTEVAALEAALAVKAPRTRPLVDRKGARTLSGLLACHACGDRLTVAVYQNPERTEYRCATRSKGSVCARPVMVSAPHIEAWAEAEYLSRFGDLVLGLPKIVTVPADGLGEAEAALQDAARRLTLPGADVAALSIEVARLAAERDRVAALPPQVVEIVPGDGRTAREVWEASTPVERRDILATALSGSPIVIGPGRRGGANARKFDAAHRIVSNPWDDVDEFEEFLAAGGDPLAPRPVSEDEAPPTLPLQGL